MSRPERLTEALMQLDARAWAQLVRSLRRRDGVPEVVAAALCVPISELSGGAGRRALCEALEATPEFCDDLRADMALPASVHRALGEGRPGSTLDLAEEDGVRDEEPRTDARLVERSRQLRRTLDDERRRREGAEVRAVAAEARLEALGSEYRNAQARIVDLEAELEQVAVSAERTAARAERRSRARAETLERELASERRAHAALRLEHDRILGELAALRAERDDLRGRPEARTFAHDVARGGRPLVLPPELDASTTAAARWLADRVSLIIVDGYNAALKLRPDLPLDGQRRWLIERLRPLAARGPAKAVVFFDGDRPSGRMTGSAGVEVRFTTRGVIADDEIVFAVAGTDEPVLVVTDDVELTQRVRADGGNVLGVLHLLGIIDG